MQLVYKNFHRSSKRSSGGLGSDISNNIQVKLHPFLKEFSIKDCPGLGESSKIVLELQPYVLESLENLPLQRWTKQFKSLSQWLF